MKTIYVIIIVIGTVILLDFIIQKLTGTFETLAKMPGQIANYKSDLSKKLKELNGKYQKLLNEKNKEVSNYKKLVEDLESEHTQLIADIEATNKVFDGVFENLQLLSDALNTNSPAVKEECIAAYISNLKADNILINSFLDKHRNHEATQAQENGQPEASEEDGEELSDE